MSVFIEYFAATLGTAYRRRARDGFVYVELVPPGSFSFVCGTVESATRSRKNSVALPSRTDRDRMRSLLLSSLGLGNRPARRSRRLAHYPSARLQSPGLSSGIRNCQI